MTVGAVAASVEDAWAATANPASLMKIRERNVNFFVSFGKKLSGRLNHADGVRVESRQPPFENMGIALALPLSTHFASGFNILHRYTHPSLQVRMYDSDQM